jgi:hypothetical protein
MNAYIIVAQTEFGTNGRSSLAVPFDSPVMVPTSINYTLNAPKQTRVCRHHPLQPRACSRGIRRLGIALRSASLGSPVT